MNFNLKQFFARFRWRYAAIAMIGLTGAAFWILAPHGPAAKRPEIGLMTTLPLLWQEGDIDDVIRSAGEPAPAARRIERNYTIRAVDSIRAETMPRAGILMLAQSRALSPGELIQLDSWVRGGGKLLLLADPALHWESAYPLGDKRRPLFTSLLSPLFRHWGLELVLPMEAGGEDLQIVELDGQSIRTATVGAWQLLDRGASGCSVTEPAIVATCHIGKGKAILVADADFLNTDYWQGTGIRAVAGLDDFGNMGWTELLLQKLISKSASD